MSMTFTFTAHRNSKTGQFCTAAYALRNPETTEAEEMPVQDLAMHRLTHCVEGMRQAAPEDTAEWLIEAQQALYDIRAAVIARQIS